MSERSKRLVVDNKENICNPRSQPQTRAQSAGAWSQSGRTHTHQCSYSPMFAHSPIYLSYMWLPHSQSIANLSCTHGAQMRELTIRTTLCRPQLSVTLERLCSPGPLPGASFSLVLRCQHGVRKREFIKFLQKWCSDQEWCCARE